MISSDNSKIYSVFVYGSAWSIYFVSFNATNGSIIGSRYKSSNSCGYVYGSTLTEKYVIFSGDCTPYVIGIFEIKTNIFTFKQFAGCFTQLTKESVNGRLLVAG